MTAKAPPVYQALADEFLRHNTTLCFALLGDANMKWAAALAERGCDFVYVRDEHCAVAAAMSWSRKAGRVGIATVTCGPGVTQILTALPAAVRASIPLVIFAGEAPLHKPWYNQKIDQAPLIEATGALYFPLHVMNTLLEDTFHAFTQAQQKQTPVVIGVPMDLQNLPLPPQSVNKDYSMLIVRNQTIEPLHVELINAVDRIEQSQRIIVMAGLGAVGAVEQCRQLAETTGALLATTLPARGLFHRDAYYLGVAGGFSTTTTREYFARADLIIAVGCSLSHHNSDGGALFDADNVIHIDVRPRQISQGRPASSLQLTTDANSGTKALVRMLQQRTQHDPGWRSASTASRIENAELDERGFDIRQGELDPRLVVKQLNQLIPSDWQLVNSSGHCSCFFSHMPGRAFEQFLTIREFGAIGNGIAFAIGVAKAAPDVPVVLFDGDGSLLMHVQELETIRRHGLKILICVMNDGAYGSEIHKLRAHGLNTDGAVFGRPDFAAIAEGFGLIGQRIETIEHIAPALSDFATSGNAAVWDFPVSDQVISPVIQRSHNL